MHLYKHHIQEDSSVVIKEYRADGVVRVVGADNSGYIEYLESDTPEDIPYVAPAAPTAINIVNEEISTLEIDLRIADITLRRDTEDIIDVLVSKGVIILEDLPAQMTDRKSSKDDKRSEMAAKIAERNALL